jgi:cellobiose phosphorylase
MTEVTLSPGETRDVVFVLGQTDSVEDARRRIRDSTGPEPPIWRCPGSGGNGTAP